MKVAINGFGRIGRAVFKICIDKKINVSVINDLHGIKDTEYLLKYDSVYGKYNREVKTQMNNLIIDNKKIKVLSEKEPAKLPWKQLGIDVVIESTGVFKERSEFENHLKAGAKNVIVTAPSEGVDITIVPGVNENKLSKKHKIISVASCTTNAAAIVIKILKDSFGVENALINTTHAYTSDQSIIDTSHKKFRRGRAAAQNIIPTSTGSSKAVCEVIPELKNHINGIAIRVPVIDGSIVDVTAILRKKVSAERINEVFKKMAKTKYKNLLEYSEEELVSQDIIGNTNSAIIDGKMTMVEGNLAKVLAWYDNEYGYSMRVTEVVEMLTR
ncbi:MAG: type I glyceraldehyde-3-phosphate dehydrogenase [Candidatus Pacearchaeota archaeon]